MNQDITSKTRLTRKEWGMLCDARTRQEVIEEVERNPTIGIGKISDIFGVSPSTVWRWRKRYKAQGLQGLLRDRRTEKPRKISHAVE
jgi:transposase